MNMSKMVQANIFITISERVKTHIAYIIQVNEGYVS